jgi:hypothetical protein
MPYHRRMKHSRLLLTILLLLCFSTHAQTSSPDDGLVRDGVYYNSFFSLSFAYPKDWVVHDEAVNERIRERAIEEAAKTGNVARQKNTYLLLAVTRHPKGTPGIPMNPAILVAAEKIDYGPGNPNGKDYLLSLRTVKQRRGDKPLLNEPVVFRVAGLQFFRDDYDRVVEGVAHKASIFVHVKKGYAVIFTFIGEDQKGVDEMARSMQTILPVGRGGNRP